MKKIPAALGLLAIGSTLLASCSNGADMGNTVDTSTETSDTIETRKASSLSRKANRNREISRKYDTRSQAS